MQDNNQISAQIEGYLFRSMRWNIALPDTQGVALGYRI